MKVQIPQSQANTNSVLRQGRKAVNTKELIDRIFKEPGIKFELTQFERDGVHTARTKMLADDIQCGDAAENSKAI